VDAASLTLAPRIVQISSQRLRGAARTAGWEQASDGRYLNEHVYWRNVPEAVWEFYIGGYQVMKKWLSYRERDLLGRPLNVEEAREATATARRLAALVLLRPQLDANYSAVATNTYAWPQ
jgi:hypothetical protein